MPRFRTRGEDRTRTRIFFATDIHGSDQCFRKWLNAAAVYDVRVLVLGGDITGKGLVPIVESGSGAWESVMNGRAIRVEGADELREFRRRIATTGFYDMVISATEKAEFDRSPELVEQQLQRAAATRLEEWVALADERLAGRDIVATFMLGNDDVADLRDIMLESKSVQYGEDSILELPGGYEMLSLGVSNPTPFHTPREASEEALDEMLTDRIRRLSRPENAIFNVHCPPRDTLLDLAPRLDENLRPIATASGVAIASVGSSAVRAAIERVQPLLGLHGHVHESPGAQELGRTLCVNPGSEYVDGVVRGALVTLTPKHGVLSWQMVQG